MSRNPRYPEKLYGAMTIKHTSTHTFDYYYTTIVAAVDYAVVVLLVP